AGALGATDGNLIEPDFSNPHHDGGGSFFTASDRTRFDAVGANRLNISLSRRFRSVTIIRATTRFRPVTTIEERAEFHQNDVWAKFDGVSADQIEEGMIESTGFVLTGVTREGTQRHIFSRFSLCHLATAA
ncbi:MAG: hypothetical protein ACHRXM_36255, partial [Isosphaerales bacterium]